MALRSELIEVELPDNAGKTVSFYTYDGFLEEDQRRTIRKERRSFEQLKVTGAALFGFVGYFVPIATRRPPVVSRCPSSVSRALPSPSAASSPESSAQSSAGTFAPSSAQADSPPFRETPSSAPRAFRCGRTFATLSTPTEPFSSWPTSATTSLSYSTPVCSFPFTQHSRSRGQNDPRQNHRIRSPKAPRTLGSQRSSLMNLRETE